MAVDLRKPQNLKSILGHCERVVSIVAQQRLEGTATTAIVAICQRTPHTAHRTRDELMGFTAPCDARRHVDGVEALLQLLRLGPAVSHCAGVGAVQSACA